MVEAMSRTIPDTLDPVRRLNAICPYYTMFPLEFPFQQLLRAEPGDWVLDPYCGRGTTNFAARLLGLGSVGIDGNPVAAAIASAKLLEVQPERIADVCRRILGMKSEPLDVPEEDFWRLCFHPKTLEGICKLREELSRQCSSQVRIALRAILLGILHGPRNIGTPTYLSNQMPRTYATKPSAAVNFWRRHRMRPHRVDVLDAVSRRAHFTFGRVPPASDGLILNEDSRTIKPSRVPRRFQWVVTSPPYFGMRTYVPDQWLRNWFIGGSPSVDYSSPKQLNHYPESVFLSQLSQVWRQTSKLCLPGARMVVRFGALPSLRRDPAALLTQSLAGADCGWRVLTVKNAGHAGCGKRQARQFQRLPDRAIAEIDLHAVLEN